MNFLKLFTYIEICRQLAIYVKTNPPTLSELARGIIAKLAIGHKNKLVILFYNPE